MLLAGDLEFQTVPVGRRVTDVANLDLHTHPRIMQACGLPGENSCGETVIISGQSAWTTPLIDSHKSHWGPARPPLNPARKGDCPRAMVCPIRVSPPSPSIITLLQMPHLGSDYLVNCLSGRKQTKKSFPFPLPPPSLVSGFGASRTVEITSNCHAVSLSWTTFLLKTSINPSIAFSLDEIVLLLNLTGAIFVEETLGIKGPCLRCSANTLWASLSLY